MASPAPTLNPLELGIKDLSRLYRSGELTPADAIEGALEMSRLRADDNIFIHLNDKAPAEAPQIDLRPDSRQSPLAGVPFVAKDNIHIAGMPNSAGTPALSGFVPQEHNPVVASLIAEGAVALGKTNLHELAFGITSMNAWSGTVGNPNAPGHLAGGSSGGTAAAIAAGIVGFGLGSDTGGSVRIPAALCGICGFRPSKGRYSAKGVTPISATRDTVGLMARWIEDIIYLDSIIAPPSEPAKPLPLQPRLGLDRDYYYSVDDSIKPSIDAALERLSQHAVLIEAPLEGWQADIQACSFPIALFEVVRDLAEYLAEHQTGLSLKQVADKIASPDVHGLFASLLGDGAMPEAAYQNGLAVRERMRERYQAYFAEHRLDAIVLPTTPLPARPIEGDMAKVPFRGEPTDTFPIYIRNTDPASVIGAPAISFPIAPTAAGLPVGLELNGLFGRDRRLLALAHRLEGEIAAR